MPGRPPVPSHGKDAGNESRPIPNGADPTVPSPARMYDYYLGGKDNYAVDREAAEKALSVVPCGRQIARANRYFLMRSVLLMADQGISQFIDLGTGIPTSPNVHEVARAIQPNARVLYVDRFGNAQLNVSGAEMSEAGIEPGGRVEVDAGAHAGVARYARTFADADEDELLAYVDSYGALALAVNRGDARARLGLVPDAAVRISRAR